LNHAGRFVTGAVGEFNLGGRVGSFASSFQAGMLVCVPRLTKKCLELGNERLVEMFLFAQNLLETGA
jgi:hypothetical protein